MTPKEKKRAELKAKIDRLDEKAEVLHTAYEAAHGVHTAATERLKTAKAAGVDAGSLKGLQAAKEQAFADFRVKGSEYNEVMNELSQAMKAEERL